MFERPAAPSIDESRLGVLTPAAYPQQSLSRRTLFRSLHQEEDHRPLTASDLRRPGHELSSEALSELERLGAECILPVLVQGQFGGFYLTGPKRSGDPYFTEDLDLISAVASQVGIAIRLHVQIGLAEAEKRRAERLVSFGAFARGLAHEIKNPLVAIRTFAELLPERASDAEFRDSFAKIVLQEIERIDQLVARLRGFAASPTVRFRPVDLYQLLRETLALLRGEIERARVRVLMTGDRSTPLILGDPAQLKQLLLNVLMNALEAIDHGGEVAIGMSHSLPSHQVVVEISDTGPGVPTELLSKMFETFVTTKPEGSGLGLAICRAIADAHHAVIRAENNSGKPGMTIILEFPLPEVMSTEPAASDLKTLLWNVPGTNDSARSESKL